MNPYINRPRPGRNPTPTRSSTPPNCIARVAVSRFRSANAAAGVAGRDKFEYLCAFCSDTVGTKISRDKKPSKLIV